MRHSYGVIPRTKLFDNLRVCVWGLRKALGDTDHRIVVSQDDNIALNTGYLDVDVRSFRLLAEQSETAALEKATTLYSGEFLEAEHRQRAFSELGAQLEREASRTRDQSS